MPKFLTWQFLTVTPLTLSRKMPRPVPSPVRCWALHFRVMSSAAMVSAVPEQSKGLISVVSVVSTSPQVTALPACA